MCPLHCSRKRLKRTEVACAHLYPTCHGCTPEPSLPLLTATHTPVLLFPHPSPLTWERWWVPGCSCCSNTFWMDSRDGRVLEASLGTQTQHRAKAVARSLCLFTLRQSHTDEMTGTLSHWACPHHVPPELGMCDGSKSQLLGDMVNSAL